MRKFVVLGAVLAVAVALVSPGVPGAGAAAGGARSWIVSVRDSASPDAVARDHARNDGADITHVYRHALRGFSARMTADEAADVAADPRVRSVVADRPVHMAPKPPGNGGGGGGGGGQTLPTGINRIDGELSSAVAGNGSGAVDVDVAVIDTGIDLSHPDLNVVGGVNCSSGSSYADGNGHGTHVAGTIGAKDNNVGVVGVAPGARLWAVRVLNNAGSGSWSSVLCGIDWVTGHASTIEAANMSLGGTGTEPAGSGCNTGDPLHDGICDSVAAGVTYAVAAGNETDDAKNHVPAAYDEVITVSALADFNGQPGGGGRATCRSDVDDTFADFSNYGADVDIIAPGVCILSTWKGGGYNTISGTSMATPHVTGAAALYLSTHAGATPAQVKSALQSAGNSNWNNSDDHDSTKEALLNVDAF